MSLFCLAVLPAIACAADGTATAGADESRTPAWVSSWAAAQQVPEPRNALASSDLEDATLRQVIRPSLGGSRMRLRISNVYGTAPLTIGKVSIARSAEPDTSTLEPASLKIARFSGREAVTIPAGAYVVTDPLDFRVAPLVHLAVSLYFPAAPERQTGHPGSRATSYILPGNRVTDETLPHAKEVDHWYQLAGLDVLATAAQTLVVIGDSITDGYGVQPNTDSRWTDFLISRVREDRGLRCTLAVLNVGLGGNRMLLDGLGPNGLARFDRDVLDRPGTRYAIVLLGVNDLGMLSKENAATRKEHDEQVDQLLAAYGQIVARAREHGIRIIGGTIMPFRGSSFYPSDDVTEAARKRVNAWIRTPGHFDAVIDFDAGMRAPDDPEVLRPGLDSGDHLHPSIAGYETMAELVPLDLFRDAARARAGDCMASP